MIMSSTSQRQSLSSRLRGTRTLLAVLVVLVLVVAGLSANAVSASSGQTITGQLFSFLGFSASSISGQDDKSGVLPQSDETRAAAKSGCDTAPEGLIACYRGD